VYAGRCGGCSWQHCDYAAQLNFKKQIVIDALERIGGISNPPVFDIIGMESPWNYRNKGIFPIAAQGRGFVMGMYEPHSHKIVDLRCCLIQHPAHEAILQAMDGFLCKHPILARKMLDVMVRVGFATGDIMAVVSVQGDFTEENGLAAELAAAGATTVILNRPSFQGRRRKDNYRTLHGTGYITEIINGISYRISAASFFQVNPIQAKILFDTALSYAALSGSQTIIDAHCGTGSMTLYAARHAKSAIGIDTASSSIRDAQKNAALNGIKNTRFINAAAETAMPKLLQAESPNVVFLDPPKAGCGEALISSLIASAPPQIIYISCDPATFARDIKQLAQGGYSPEAVQPVDMFPMTAHVEIVASLRHSNAYKPSKEEH